MRGISSGGDGVHSGSMPSIGVYLDEQPVTTIGQILDVNVYDIARVETLSGPQGTLFGQGSQSGTIRIITNKPEVGQFEAGYDAYGDTVIERRRRLRPRRLRQHPDRRPHGGAPGRLAQRRRRLDRQRARGDRLHPRRLHARQPRNSSRMTSNTVKTSGARALLKIDLNDNWSVTPGIMYQESSVNGIWFDNEPYTGREFEVTRFFPDTQDEDWYQASLTLEGQIGDLNLVYAGAYLDRNVESNYDYSGYAEYMDDLYDYYGYACYLYDAQGGCADPSQYVFGDQNWERQSHEIRLQSGQDQRFRWIAGLFYQRQEHYFDLQWTVPDLNPAQTVVDGRAVVWQTNQDRVDRDEAVFGEVYFDITDTVTLIGGARYFEYENSLVRLQRQPRPLHRLLRRKRRLRPGFQRRTAVPLLQYRHRGRRAGRRRLGLQGQRPVERRRRQDAVCDLFRGLPGRRREPRARAGHSPVRARLGLQLRTGLENPVGRRRRALQRRAFTSSTGKTSSTASSISTISNLTIIQNVGKAQTKGLEFELDWAAAEGLLLSLAGSYNDSTLQEDFWRSAEDRDDGLPPDAPDGTEMPYVPEWQYTALARYNFDVGNLPWFAQGAWSWRDETLERPRSIQHAAREDGFLRRAEPVDRHRERALDAEPVCQQRDRRTRSDQHRRPGL